jgi:hypothetical protein
VEREGGRVGLKWGEVWANAKRDGDHDAYVLETGEPSGTFEADGEGVCADFEGHCEGKGGVSRGKRDADAIELGDDAIAAALAAHDEGFSAIGVELGMGQKRRRADHPEHERAPCQHEQGGEHADCSEGESLSTNDRGRQRKRLGFRERNRGRDHEGDGTVQRRQRRRRRRSGRVDVERRDAWEGDAKHGAAGAAGVDGSGSGR